jgi:putative hydrolase of the HAD superfamily
MKLPGMLEECRAIVFDLDDTLYAQVDFKRSGLRVVANHLAARQLADAALALAALERQMAALGPSHPRIFDAAVAELGLAGVRVDELVTVFRAHQPAIRPFPGVVDLLEDLRGGYRLGLLTDGLAAVQRRKVDALGLDGCFDAMLFSDEMNTHKPDQALYAWFEQRFGLAGGQLMYVGDNPAKDFMGANERGWRTVRVFSGEHADTIAQAAGYDAELRVRSVTDLRPWVSSGPRRAGAH